MKIFASSLQSKICTENLNSKSKKWSTKTGKLNDNESLLREWIEIRRATLNDEMPEKKGRLAGCQQMEHCGMIIIKY